MVIQIKISAGRSYVFQMGMTEEEYKAIDGCLNSVILGAKSDDAFQAIAPLLELKNQMALAFGNAKED